MYDNAIKCIESDYPAVIALGKALGALKADGVAQDGVAWDYIGFKPLGGGTFLQDGSGNKYVHVNVRTPFSVGVRAAELAGSNPTIAAALSEVGRYFVVDGFGQSVNPEFAMRSFA